MNRPATLPISASRNHALDWLRGLLLVIMTLDHLPGMIRHLSYEALGFASAAEGFVFLSGFVAAMVYGRQTSPAARRTAVFSRIGAIYKYHLIVMLLILALSLLLPWYSEHWAFWLQPMDKRPAESLLLAFGLLYQPQYLDILPMYCVFMAALPWALSRLRAGQGVGLLATSFLLWLVGQFFTGTEKGLRDFFEMPIELGFFNLLAWQFLFTLGAYFGFRQREGWRPRFSAAKVIAALIVVVFLFALRHQLAGLVGIPVGAATERSALAWLRLLDVMLLAYLITGLAVAAPRLLRSRFLEALGKNSLQVYAYHVLLVYLLSPVLKPLVAEHGLPVDLLLSTLAVASLGLPVVLYRLYLDTETRLGAVWQRWLQQAR